MKARQWLGLAVNLGGGALGAEFLIQWLTHSPA